MATLRLRNRNALRLCQQLSVHISSAYLKHCPSAIHSAHPDKTDNFTFLHSCNHLHNTQSQWGETLHHQGPSINPLPAPLSLLPPGRHQRYGFGATALWLCLLQPADLSPVQPEPTSKHTLLGNGTQNQRGKCCWIIIIHELFYPYYDFKANEWSGSFCWWNKANHNVPSNIGASNPIQII